jgi:hypothetical protein|tara:strand:+ start:382 stop:831 length:450 start_codon:yes stop_codon:yes gene_type:complete
MSQAFAFAWDLVKDEKPGLWANIRAKRKRGEKPAKPGDKDYPDKKNWDKLTRKSGDCGCGVCVSINGILEKAGPNLSVGRGEKQSVKEGGGLTAKGRRKYNKATGSNLKPPVTSDNPKGKDAARKKSFCARSRGWKGERGKAARRRWKC